MRITILAPFVLLVAQIGSCLSDEASQEVATTANVTASAKGREFQIIGYLEKRDCVITMKSGPNGRVFSVATKDGKLLHDNLSAEQLRAKSPELHDLIKTGNAGDARLRPVAISVSIR